MGWVCLVLVGEVCLWCSMGGLWLLGLGKFGLYECGKIVCCCLFIIFYYCLRLWVWCVEGLW